MHVIYRIDSHDSAIRAGEWQRRGDFSFSLTPLWELSNRTIGIVGLGRIGTATAKLAEAFGMNVLAYSPRPHAGDGLKSLEWVELDELFSRSHVISLHCPQTPTNAGFVNRALLSRVRPNCILVNASRGGLVNERDLAEALNDGQLAAAVLDVVSAEPIHEHNPLLTAKNCFLTPHLAWATREARLRLMKETARNCREFMAGHPVNVVNGVHSVRLHAGSSKP
jgi:glycerate dehydrogenase